MENSKLQNQLFLSFVLSPNFYGLMVRVLIGILMICMSLWLLTGIYNLLQHLFTSITGNWGHETENIIIDVVLILAILELVRTIQSYLELGRVKVTLILDAALVVLIGELISLWYRDYTTSEVMLSMGVITMLTLLRIVTVKFSPEQCGESDDETNIAQHKTPTNS